LGGPRGLALWKPVPLLLRKSRGARQPDEYQKRHSYCCAHLSGIVDNGGHFHFFCFWCADWLSRSGLIAGDDALVAQRVDRPCAVEFAR